MSSVDYKTQSETVYVLYVILALKTLRQEEHKVKASVGCSLREEEMKKPGIELSGRSHD